MRIAALAAAAGLCGLGAAMPAAASVTAPATAPVTAPAAGQATISGVSSLTAIACPTAKACVAVGLNDDDAGVGVAINAATGAVKVWSGSLASVFPEGLACPSKTTCLAAATDKVASVKVSDGAMKLTATMKPPATGINAADAIACAGTKACYAVGFKGTEAASKALLVKLSAAGKIVKTTTTSGTGIGAIACPSRTTCLLAEHRTTGEFIVPLTNGKLGSSRKLPADTYVQELSCFSTKLCCALGGKTSSGGERTDKMIPLNAKTGKPGKAVSIGTVNGDGVACYSATQCVVVGFTGTGSSAVAASVVVTKGKAGSVTHYTSLSEPFAAVACATSKRCYGVAPSGSDSVVVKV
jgi:hypothetical protein